MRIDKYLSNMGFGSRKEVKILLKTKAVEVNGEVVRDPKSMSMNTPIRCWSAGSR